MSTNNETNTEKWNQFWSKTKQMHIKTKKSQKRIKHKTNIKIRHNTIYNQTTLQGETFRRAMKTDGATTSNGNTTTLYELHRKTSEDCHRISLASRINN